MRYGIGDTREFEMCEETRLILYVYRTFFFLNPQTIIISQDTVAISNDGTSITNDA